METYLGLRSRREPKYIGWLCEQRVLDRRIGLHGQRFFVSGEHGFQGVECN
jgi:hypothetical protein